MPELPEVEMFKKYFDKTSLNKVIKKIRIRDDRVLEVPENRLKKLLVNKKFKKTIRHGKYLFIHVDSHHLVLHFGMTGDLYVFDEPREEPKHSRVLFEFNESMYLSYISQRMFGKVDICKKVEDYIEKKKLGPDALKMTYEDFLKTLKRRTTIGKTFLMNQNIIAGIGNIYSDEILFRTKLNPKTKINRVSEEKLKELFHNIKVVLKYGIEKKGKLESYSKNLLIPHRQKEDNCPNCGTQIERYETSGRHGFFCPKCQK